MGSTCILTDCLAQFSQPGFPGREDVRILPFSVRANGAVHPEGEGLRPANLPSSLNESSPACLIEPDVDQIAALLHNLAGQYTDVIAILSSSELVSGFSRVQLAGESVRGQINLILIDSQTVSVGLGLLVQIAAEATARSLPAAEIEKTVRKYVPQVYTLICTAGLSYLSKAGFIDDAQAVAGEMLALLPIFSLEDGKLSPIDKARNLRGVLEHFSEFLGEFDDLQHIAYIQGSTPFNHEIHALREFAQQHYARTAFSEHPISLPVAALLGPRTASLVLLESA